MCVRVGGDVIFFGTEILNKWRSVPAMPPFPEFTSPLASKRYAKGCLGGSLSFSQVFLYRTVLFPNRDYSPLFHRRILVNQNKKGLSSFELLLSLLNV